MPAASPQRRPAFSLLAEASAEDPDDFARSVATGLSDHPRWLHCRFLYDRTGSEIFERICEQPEYYPTRREAEILERHAAEIRALTGPQALVELGSGNSRKTRFLIQAWIDAQPPRSGPARYVPIDVSRTMLEGSGRELVRAFSDLEVTGIASTYDRGLPLLRGLGPVTLLFLGSTIGNLNPGETTEFLDRVAASLAPGDHFLVGLDLVKDVAVLEAAYDDAAGWSAAFTRNLFARMNRELGTTLDVERIEHVAYFNDRLSRIEIYARFPEGATIHLAGLDQRFRIARGEMISTEISRKFRIDDFVAGALPFGFELRRSFLARDASFAVVLLRRRAANARRAAREASVQSLLSAVRRRTLDVIGAVDPADTARQVDPILSPMVWDLQHIAAYEAQWLHPDDSGRGRREIDRRFDPIATPRAVRGHLSLPDLDRCLADLAAVREVTLRELAHASLDPGDPLQADGFVHRMVAQHEAQHLETILQSVQLLDGPLSRDARMAPPSRAHSDPRAAPDETVVGSVLVPAGEFVLGTDDTRWSYDNERPAHRCFLPAYRIDVAPVSNRQFLEFISDGGYQRPELWCEAGREWLRSESVRCPRHWRRHHDAAWRERFFGSDLPLHPDRPVVHVSWFEADAFARWRGARLPSEAEWEKAASWDPHTGLQSPYPWGHQSPTADQANLDGRHGTPAVVGSYPLGRSALGCHQLLGDVWEWTASEFHPYPGFVAFPYPEYSAIHFGRGYRVLRGGSFVTCAVAVRNTFRNWDLPQRRQIFAGFRCASDA